MSDRFACYMGNFVALTNTLRGHKMYIDTEDVICSPHLLVDGEWESWISKFLLDNRILQEGCAAIDVGAHVGWYTLLFGQMVGPDGTVLSYEPNPKLFKLLNRSISINGYQDRCAVLDCVASNVTAILQFEIPKGRSGNGHVLEAGSLLKSSAIKVDASTIDSDVPKNIEIDLIKIDAEGHESHVLRGAMETIKRSRSIKLLVEHHGPDHRLGAALREEMEMFAELKELGFAIAVLEHDSVLATVKVEDLPNVPDSEMLYLERVRS